MTERTGISSDLAVFEDGAFAVEHASSCAVPGYVIVRLKGGATSLSQLEPEVARDLGTLLADSVRAVEEVTGAERVYVLVFAEIDRRLHFHLFPRTRWLLDAYWRATGSASVPVNGPAVFEWARSAFPRGAALPAEALAVPAACRALRERLSGAGRAGSVPHPEGESWGPP